MIRKCSNEVGKNANSENEHTLCIDYLKTEVSPTKRNDKRCCVCLNSFLALNSLSKSDNGLNLLNKLQINIPQVVSDFFIFHTVINITTFFLGMAIRLFYL